MNNWKSNGRRAAAAAMTAAMLTTAWAVPASADEAVSGGGTPANVESAAGSAPAKPDAGAAVKTAIGKTKAEQLLRQYINIPKEYELQGASSGTSKLADGTRSYWSLNFVKRVNGKQRGSIHASLDASSGQLLSFSAYSDEQNAPPVYPLKVDREDAKGLAATFIGQVAADYKSAVKLNENFGISLLPPLTGSVRHTLRYERVVNGITFPANYIQVEMDSDGHVQGFELNWDETIEFPKAGSILSAADGLAAIREAAEPQLRYIVPYNASGERKPALSYALPAFAVDASTGERAAATDFYGYNRGTVSETPLSDKPLGAKPKGAKLTEEAARETVEKSFELPGGYELDQATYNEYKDELTGKLRATWDLNWTFKKDGRDSGGAWANVDAETGIIRSFYGYASNAGENASSSPSITLESAIEKAKETVRKQLPWLTDELYVIIPDAELYKDRKPEEIGGYSISFEHQVHGAVADYDRVSVAIDAKSGKVQSFEASIADYAYPAKKPSVLSEAEAVDRWLDYYESKLQYRMSSQYWWDGQPLPIEKVKVLIAAGEADEELLKQKVTVELVYQLAARPVHEQVYLDAVTGEWRSADTGEKAALELPRATDAEGHWAEQSLQLMVAYKALDLQDGKVRPNEAITRGELIKMLVLASSGGRYASNDSALASGEQAKAMFNDVAADSAYFSYVQTAVANNLIDVGDGSFNPDGKVTRDEMSELIVRALGYNSLANYDHMFKVSFKDEADIDNKGQAAIVVGLKIMSLAEGRFLPDKQVTRAEASIAFYRYLQKRAELQENPLRM